MNNLAEKYLLISKILKIRKLIKDYDFGRVLKGTKFHHYIFNLNRFDFLLHSSDHLNYFEIEVKEMKIEDLEFSYEIDRIILREQTFATINKTKKLIKTMEDKHADTFKNYPNHPKVIEYQKKIKSFMDEALKFN